LVVCLRTLNDRPASKPPLRASNGALRGNSGGIRYAKNSDIIALSRSSGDF
jgi:hypothetical protein